MTRIITGLSVSLDGFIAGREGNGRLHAWLSGGDTPSRYRPSFTMSRSSAAVFDEAADRVGAVVTGRRTYEESEAWGGHGPFPGVPLIVVTHRVPEQVPSGDPPYTFVTDGIERAVSRAQAAAAGKDVNLMGADIVQQCLRAGLLEEIHINVIPVLLGGGVRLFDHLGDDPVELECTRVVEAPGVTHLSYRVIK